MKRMLKLAGATAVASALFTGTAYAHYCTNVSKKDGAGNAGVLFADVSSGDFTVVPEKSTVKMNSQGRITGGFLTLHIDVTGDGAHDIVFEDVYAQTGLPDGALLAAGCGQATETNIPFFPEACPPTP